MASINLNVGGGFIEIAALTALIGSTTAESLVLGSRGAPGLPFAAMSAFGSPFLIKACISACTPDWLRETMGVRNTNCDIAVGLKLLLQSLTRRNRTQGGPAGISVSITRVRFPE